MTITESARGLAPVEKFVDTPGFRIHYTEAGSGHPVVLLHGGGPGATGANNFAPNISELGQDLRVLAPDMPGWGETATSVGGGRDHVAALIELLDALDIERAALVGNSVGGMTAVSTAIAHPERVSHLITLGAPAPTRLVLTPGGAPSEGMRALVAAYRAPTLENIKNFIRIMCFDQGFATDEFAQTRLAAVAAHPEHIDSWNAVMGTADSKEPPYFQLGDRLSTITAPTMAIQGRDDRVVHFENSLILTSRIFDSRLVMLNRCGHWAQLEHAAEFNRLVSSFVGGA